jgi:recombination associated protein RdgC
MFKNAILYRIDPTWKRTTAQMEGYLSHLRYVPCAATAAKSQGWSSPRGEEHGMLVESVSGQWILQLTTESKVLPRSVIKRNADIRIKKLEEAQGRRIGRIERKDLFAETELDMLPKAFTRIVNTKVWISPESGLVLIDAASDGLADEVVAAILRCVEGIVLTPLATVESPQACMTTWLNDHEVPGRFGIDHDCELKATDDSKAVARYSKHNLDFDELRVHLRNGKVPTKLALLWNDRVSFTLTSKLQLKNIKFLEASIDEQGSDVESASDRFDGDVAITTGEISSLVSQLFENLGGELVAS